MLADFHQVFSKNNNINGNFLIVKYAHKSNPFFVEWVDSQTECSGLPFFS